LAQDACSYALSHRRTLKGQPHPRAAGTSSPQKPWSERVWWAREELNLRPLPCQIPRAAPAMNVGPVEIGKDHQKAADERRSQHPSPTIRQDSSTVMLVATAVGCCLSAAQDQRASDPWSLACHKRHGGLHCSGYGCRAAGLAVRQAPSMTPLTAEPLSPGPMTAPRQLGHPASHPGADASTSHGHGPQRSASLHMPHGLGVHSISGRPLRAAGARNKCPPFGSLPGAHRPLARDE
jgi:hypothetical protein